ncbi:putative secreted protein (Por secretion system target) [Aquimarina sp. MAR_2010_214]|uniref:zinc-dependent metalloprotease n=1 Tax=Aquimarina sp. MAR_2010_214 TaxID=1250026 RepID=UPI000C704228|nr:GEVED domain-containing protein [Aquimarina sp. MAR_2010_214]PKV50397.1 putative secreted protein (Por secretion system target) [Aquimarina sp. MAR_2010_214]
MKRILTIAIAFFTVMSFAQTQLQKPSELVAQQKSSGSNFETTQLFTTVDQKSNLQIPKELKDYVLLSLDQSKMKSLQGNFPNTMNLSIPGQKSAMSLDLVKVSIRTDDFSAIDMPSGKVLSRDNVAHYRGVVKGQTNSLVALSFYEDNVSGFISIDGQDGNMVVGPVSNSKSHILYKDKEISHLYDFSCQVEDDIEKGGYTIEELADNPQSKAAAKCVKVFFDICTDIVNDKGGAQQASNYIEAVFNQVAALYANDQISIKLSGTKAWTSNQPFSNNDLNSYISYKNSNGLNGDLAHMVNYSYGGGLAGGIGTLCNSSRKAAVSGIKGSYQNIPTYSFDVFLISHEMGHNVGSRHTHACVWNGNNTAIDGCAGFTEGGCSLPGNPSGGGTIMSYCPKTTVGVNFNKGFGSQPANVIRNYIAGSSCLQACDGNPDPTNYCASNGKNTSDEYISKVVLGTINKTSVAGSGGYSDFTAESTNLSKGTSNTITITPTWTGTVYNEAYAVWIDYNQDGDFKDSGELVWSKSASKTTPVSGSFSVVSGAKDGSTRMRVSMKYNGIPTSCESFQYGEVEDYTVVIGAKTEANSNLCDNGISYDVSANYESGDRVTYNGSLYERTATGWTNLGSCGDKFAGYKENGSVGELQFKAFPNPVKNLLNLEINNVKSASSQISIKDINGRTLEIIDLKTPPGGNVVRKTVDISKLSTGIYFVQVTTSSRTLTQKIFVK